ncbi:hypothetical protein V8J36_20495, partial [Frigidibacter sp. MR17.14]|uniref:5-methylcytosine restriction system specificity protein McrC n=1 Tax=Frigidibacter sp. MR17.14 TaxID=3126509 RepID=UPI00303FD939
DNLFRLVLLLSHIPSSIWLESLLQGGPLFRGQTRSRVSAQGGHRDCLFEESTGRFRTKPDLIIRQGDRTVLVIDTKWKRMSPRIDDPKQGVSQADVYQLMAYSQLYQCQNVMLLYPHYGDLPPDPIRTCYAIANAGAKENLVVATLDVTGPSRAHVQALEALVQSVLSKSEAA